MSNATTTQSHNALWHVQSDARIWDENGDTAEQLVAADTRAHYENALEHYREAVELLGRRATGTDRVFLVAARTALHDARRDLARPDEPKSR